MVISTDDDVSPTAQSQFEDHVVLQINAVTHRMNHIDNFKDRGESMQVKLNLSQRQIAREFGTPKKRQPTPRARRWKR
jgi:hypothetical protein